MIDVDKLKEIDKRYALQEDKVLYAALYYANEGIYVIPIRANAKSLPETKTGLSYYSASRKPETMRNWFGPGGKFRGYNIGLACGKEDGIIAVDLDVKDDISGEAEFRSIAYENGGDIGNPPIQSTPSGGKHFIYSWVNNARSSTSKIARNVDTRGGYADKIGGHIVVWPSTVDEGQYQWESSGEISPPPLWITDCLGAAWENKSVNRPAGRGNEEVEESDFERSYSISEFERIVSYIDADSLSYDEWLWVGQAIHTQHPNEDGLTVWDTWSQTGERYTPNECTLRWDKFAEEGPIRVGTLVHLAARFGYNPKTHGKPKVGNEENDEKREDVIAEMNKRFAVIVIGGSVRILMERAPSKIDPLSERFVMMDRSGFQTLMANDLIAVPDKKGNPVLMSKGDLWLGDQNRRTYPSGIIFSPGSRKEVDGYYNTWEQWRYNEKPSPDASWDMFKSHIKNEMCNGNLLHYVWILDWMADVIQDPRNPKGAAVILSGEEGTGKGTFAHLFGELFGIHYKHVTDEDHLIGKFNGHLQDSMLVFADEVTYGGNKKTAGKLKALVTEPFLMTEFKNVNAYRSANYIRLIVASNEEWFVPAGPQSRRWFVLKMSSSYANDANHFHKMREQMKNGGYQAMMTELANRDITSNLRWAPETETLNEQRAILSTNDPVIEWWTGCLENEYINGIEGFTDWEPGAKNIQRWPEGVKLSTTEFYGLYEDWAMERRVRRSGLTQFMIKIQKLGFEKQRLRRGEKRMMGVVIPPYGIAVQKLSDGAGIKISQE